MGVGKITLLKDLLPYRSKQSRKVEKLQALVDGNGTELEMLGRDGNGTSREDLQSKMAGNISQIMQARAQDDSIMLRPSSLGALPPKGQQAWGVLTELPLGAH